MTSALSVSPITWAGGRPADADNTSPIIPSQRVRAAVLGGTQWYI